MISTKTTPPISTGSEIYADIFSQNILRQVFHGRISLKHLLNDSLKDLGPSPHHVQESPYTAINKPSWTYPTWFLDRIPGYCWNPLFVLTCKTSLQFTLPTPFFSKPDLPCLVQPNKWGVFDASLMEVSKESTVVGLREVMFLGTKPWVSQTEHVRLSLIWQIMVTSAEFNPNGGECKGISPQCP